MSFNVIAQSRDITTILLGTRHESMEDFMSTVHDMATGQRHHQVDIYVKHKLQIEKCRYAPLIPGRQLYRGERFYLWHQMEKFTTALALCEGNPLVTGGFPF